VLYILLQSLLSSNGTKNTASKSGKPKQEMNTEAFDYYITLLRNLRDVELVSRDSKNGTLRLMVNILIFTDQFLSKSKDYSVWSRIESILNSIYKGLIAQVLSNDVEYHIGINDHLLNERPASDDLIKDRMLVDALLQIYPTNFKVF
jgi:hypothetical protein